MLRRLQPEAPDVDLEQALRQAHEAGFEANQALSRAQALSKTEEDSKRLENAWREVYEATEKLWYEFYRCLLYKTCYPKKI